MKVNNKPSGWHLYTYEVEISHPDGIIPPMEE